MLTVIPATGRVGDLGRWDPSQLQCVGSPAGPSALSLFGPADCRGDGDRPASEVNMACLRWISSRLHASCTAVTVVLLVAGSLAACSAIRSAVAQHGGTDCAQSIPEIFTRV